MGGGAEVSQEDQGWLPMSISQNWPSESRSFPPRSRPCGGFFDVDGKRLALDLVEQQLTQPEVWSDQERSKTLQQQKSRLQAQIDSAGELQNLLEEAETFLELFREGESVGDDLGRAVRVLRDSVESIELSTLLCGDHDASDAILEIHPGAGGTESQDWAEMLLRMYSRWAENRGFKVETLDLQVGEEAGIKSATHAAHLCIHHDIPGHLCVCRFMKIDMANALQVSNDGHARLFLYTLDQVLAAARHDDVDRVSHRR